MRLDSQGAARFDIDATLRHVPAVEFNAYLRNALGIDVESGSLDAELALVGAPGAPLRGSVTTRVHGVDLVALQELAEGRPLNWLWQALVAAAVEADTQPEEPFELRLELRERLGDPSLGSWSLLGDVVRGALLGLLESPVAVTRWLSERIVEPAAS